MQTASPRALCIAIPLTTLEETGASSIGERTGASVPPSLAPGQDGPQVEQHARANKQGPQAQEQEERNRMVPVASTTRTYKEGEAPMRGLPLLYGSLNCGGETLVDDSPEGCNCFLFCIKKILKKPTAIQRRRISIALIGIAKLCYPIVWLARIDNVE